MTGRLENQIKTEQKIKRTLKSLPQIVADFYYNISTSTEPKSCYMYIMIIKGFIEFIEELNKLDESFHKTLQELVEINSNKDKNTFLNKKAEEVENKLAQIFENLNNLKKYHCKENQK